MQDGGWTVTLPPGHPRVRPGVPSRVEKLEVTRSRAQLGQLSGISSPHEAPVYSSPVKGRAQGPCGVPTDAPGLRPPPAGQHSQRLAQHPPWKAMALPTAASSCEVAQPACSSRRSTAGGSFMAQACLSPSTEGRGQGGPAVTDNRREVGSAPRPAGVPAQEGGREGGAGGRAGGGAGVSHRPPSLHSAGEGLTLGQPWALTQP